MSNIKKLESMKTKWELLAEQYDCIKQFLLETIGKPGVFPTHVISSMQKKLARTDEKIIKLEADMKKSGHFMWPVGGGVYIKPEQQ